MLLKNFLSAFQPVGTITRAKLNWQVVRKKMIGGTKNRISMTQAKIYIAMVEFSSNWKHIDKILFKTDFKKRVKMEKETLPKHCSIFVDFFYYC